MTIPTFFIIGAPKCGTTALSSYLAQHPGVLFADPKEPKYFHTDFDERHRQTLSPEEYDRCFAAERTSPPKAIGEGTVWYLYSREAVPNILRLNPQAKFIVMLRNPVEVAYSLHAQFVYGGFEDIGDFEQAWRSQEKRRSGRAVPPLCPDHKLLLYGDVAALGTQCERLFRIVDPAQVHVVLFDDFARDTRASYAEVLEFLDLPDDGRARFEIENPSKIVTRPGTARLIHRLNVIKRRLGWRGSLGVWRALSPWLAEPGPRPDMPPILREELREYFAGEVARLAELIEQDLSAWSR
ncbi:MAG: sulfotransferase [Acidobacteriota bacterium]|jgi:hypothetical protein